MTTIESENLSCAAANEAETTKPTSLCGLIDPQIWTLLAALGPQVAKSDGMDRYQSSTHSLENQSVAFDLSPVVQDELFFEAIAEYVEVAERAFIDNLATLKTGDKRLKLVDVRQQAGSHDTSTAITALTPVPALLAAARHQLEVSFRCFFQSMGPHIPEILIDGPEALDQDIRHWIADTQICGSHVNEFTLTLQDPLACALCTYLNLRTRMIDRMQIEQGLSAASSLGRSH